eukprot:TRINITY_DN2408_c2_g1_i2.p1 TRINITY_DN2408_c2_g1~~TRINITY_DN2408_c2_g1_i2.p1  ORF type:complete len:352 (-),score=53.58 TRINITY_DN2408_c2_g1_i2:94-1149(-)
MKIQDVYKDMDVSFDSFPPDDVSSDRSAYIHALDTMKQGDLVYIFTPDHLHFTMAKEAVERGLHVLVTKPIVKSLENHLELCNLAKLKNVLVAVEVHKRWDPMYSDVQQRSKTLGEFSYFYSYMSQPKAQLVTFKSWAGKSSDISYYLNSHHVDFHCWIMQGTGRPERVTAVASTGVASSPTYGCNTEDTVTLMVQWINNDSGNKGTAVYTASWIAPKADVHSQQRFHYMGTKGEVQIDQAHRGYICARDDDPYSSINPIYMKYTPDTEGYFSGQMGYGYRSLEDFTRASINLRNGNVKDPQHYNLSLATVWVTTVSTAILHAGRLSLDSGKSILIHYDDNGCPLKLEIVS